MMTRQIYFRGDLTKITSDNINKVTTLMELTDVVRFPYQQFATLV